MKSQKRIAIYYDIFLSDGGASKVVLDLAKYLGADLIVAGVSPKTKEQLNFKNKFINIGNVSLKFHVPLAYLFEAPLRFLFYKGKPYDINIFAGQSSIYAARKGQKNIYFCFSPNRVLYDLRSWTFQKSNPILKILYLFYIMFFYYLDQHVVKNKFSEIIAQSKTVQKRISKYYNLDSEVIYSSFDAHKYKFRSFGNYYLAVSRLTPEKRMHLIAGAFKNNPDKNLVMVGRGIEEKKIRKLIKGYKNIKLLTKVSDQDLVKLYSNCLATIYMPKEEDFGLVPVESMASGKCCIAANEGGCKETVLPGKTGYLIKPTEDEIEKVILNFTKEDAKKMKNKCIDQAKNYDSQNIFKKWESLVYGNNLTSGAT